MDEEKNLSVYSDRVKEAIEVIPQELYLLSENQLIGRVKPTLKMYEIKRKFWEELLVAQERGKRMRNWRVYDNCCSKEYFYRDIISNPAKMAWITSPLDSYEDKSKAALDMVTQRYEDLISMDINTTKKRKVDGEWEEYQEVCPKKALVLLQVIKNLEDRIKGTAVQRQININTNEPSKKTKGELDMDAVNSRLIELEEQLNETNGQEGIRGEDVGDSEGEDLESGEYKTFDAEFKKE